MKNITGILLLAVLALFLPFSVSALSCMPENEMISRYATDDNIIVFIASPDVERDYVLSQSEFDPNGFEGYTAQHLQISKSYKGNIPDDLWVYFSVDGTWGYLCVSNPPQIDNEALYVVSLGEGNFGLNTVMAVYDLESSVAQNLISAIDVSEEPDIYHYEPKDRLMFLANDIKRMITIIKIKMDEWRYWKSL